jgi:4-carboxymuconolactone decarboxylase
MTQPSIAQPRIAPLTETECNEEQRELIAKGGPMRQLNIFRTLVRHTALYRAFMKFGGHILGANTLDPRSRELLILRAGHLSKCAYEVHQHNRIGKSVGLGDAELERIAVGPSAPEWSARERTLLQAADELHGHQKISDATWAVLVKDWNEQQLMDLVFTVGQYTMVSMFLSTFGVQIERA